MKGIKSLFASFSLEKGESSFFERNESEKLLFPRCALQRFSADLAGRRVLEDVSFSAGAGEFVAVCGPNGAGKTTFLRALAGLLPGAARSDPRRVAYLEQGARCAWGLTVADIARLGRLPHGGGGEAAVTRALVACGVAGLAERRVDQISGGQARRAMLARALATEPAVLLLDEPVADLDPRAAHEILALLRRFAEAGGLVVAVLHAVELAAAYASRMLVLEDGRVVADGPPLAALPEAARCFGLRLGMDESLRLLAPDWE
jgi:iron complex transport system ATP-binding protein